jgi:SAM-dependent methyltransferase
MDIELEQRGRASIDFLVSAARASGRLEPAVRTDMAAAGLGEATLAEDLDDRLAQVDMALSGSAAFRVRNLLSEWLSVNHGLVARDAFEAIRPALQPQIEALSQGPATLTVLPHFTPPEYLDGVWIHRTHGGWDGHEHQGLIHAEFVHRRYLTSVYGGDIFAQRRAVLDHLPRRDYRRIFEMGVSSGYHTLGLADAFPQAQISGCDCSGAMLEEARRRANERRLPWTLFVGRAEDTRLPPQSFDLVSSFILLHELPARIIAEVFAEAWRLLEPGGAMIMTDVPPYAQQDKLSVWRQDRGAVHGGEPYWREAGQVDTVALARAAGFAAARAFPLPGGGGYWVTLAEKA